MGKTIKKHKPTRNVVSRAALMNLNQLLPSRNDYTRREKCKALAESVKCRALVESVKRNTAELLNLCCKYSEEKNKSFRLAGESVESAGSTAHSKSGEQLASSYYLHKVFLGMMRNDIKEAEYSAFKEHFDNTVKVLGLINNIKKEHSSKSAQSMEMRHKHAKKLLVLDLDETLISSNECPPHNWDNTEIINFQLANGFTYTIYVKFRPFVFTFLEEMAKHFELAIFTASEKAYADAIINKLDPERTLISRRLYNTECDQLNGIFVKDMSKLGRNLKDVIIVDNTALCFAFQLENGVPILSYYGSGKEQDTELVDLMNFLLSLKDVEDVRTSIVEYFKWGKLCEHYKEREKVIESIFYE